MVRLMRLLPVARSVFLFGGRDVDGVVQPAVPAGRDRRGLDRAVIDDPATLDAEGLVLGATLGAVIDVAELVLADLLAEAPGVEARAEGLAVPPSEDLKQGLVHRSCPEALGLARLMSSSARDVQCGRAQQACMATALPPRSAAAGR
jgi:hypothetical protein